MSKKILTALMAILLCVQTYAQRPVVGLVLCGGGAKGAAHIGVLKVLEENDIPVDLIVGTSMGAIMGGLYAVGYKAAEIDSIVMMQDWNKVMSGGTDRSQVSYRSKADDARLMIKVPFGIDFSKSLSQEEEEESEDEKNDYAAPEVFNFGGLPVGLLGGQNIYRLLTDYTVGYHNNCDFSKLPIPFACVAVDLVSQKEVVLNNGILAKAMRASMAIPGAFAPVRLDDMVLVDGGLTNNYPVDVAKEMGADIIIGVRLGYDDEVKRDYESLGGIFGSVLEIAMYDKMDKAMEDTDILIAPSVKGFNTMSFDTRSLRTLIDNGETAARSVEDKIKELRVYLNKKEAEAANSFVGPAPKKKSPAKAISVRDTISLASIQIEGGQGKEIDRIMSKCGIVTGKDISTADIENAVNDIYATGAYSSVTYALEGKRSPFALVMSLVPNHNHQLGLGVRFDSEEVSAVLLDVGFNRNKLSGHKLDISGRITANYGLDVKYSYQGEKAAQFNAAYSLRHYDMKILSEATEKYNYLDYLQNVFEVSLSTKNLRNINTEAGAQFRIYNYMSQVNIPGIPSVYDTDDGQNQFAGVFARMGIDNFDNAAFPRKGLKIDARADYLADITNFETFSPFLSAQFSFKWALSPTRHLTLLPFVNTRAVVGEDVPAVFMNAVGGYQAGRYSEYQLPFYGLTGALPADRLLAIGGADLRCRIFDSHYIFLGGNYVRSSGSIAGLLESPGYMGYRLGYMFDFKFGPLEFDLHWNDYTRKAGAYVSLGYWF